jgi:7,8-dihydropterin-6-yl-methyl-4-(beta-D-ribofuranosyl)aminobenzene 5'-phosphate synthase
MTNTAQTPPPEDPPMEIHKPKPIHNWREFIKEVGIIVLGACIVLSAASGAAPAADAQKQEVHALKITVLVTNLAGNARAGDGEWGYSALVEADGHKILYDTGSSADMVLKNARALHVDLSDVEDVILSHNHWDHVAGLMTLRREFAKTNPKAFSRVHVAAGIFEPRLDAAGQNQNGLRDIRAEYLATGGTFIVHDKPAELLPGVWLSGPVPRPHPEKNWSPGLSLRGASGLVEDNVPEDSALVINTAEGTVILTGCGHAGIINIAEYARAFLGGNILLAVMGGIHLFAAPDQTVEWTGARLKQFGIKNLLAGHCTGIEATYILRKATSLDRKTAMVSTVGSSFILGRGIVTGALAQ